MSVPANQPTLHAVTDASPGVVRQGARDAHEIRHAHDDPFAGPPSTVPAPQSEEAPSRIERVVEAGQRVGRYRTEALLGKGGMGLVLRARDDILQRTVAIKLIQPQYLAADPTAGLRFLREAEILATLSHPHVISVLDAGLDEGTAFLVFSFVDGKNFSQLRAERPLGATEAVDLLLPVVSAAAHAHRLGIVHGDLKPTNLILGQDYRGAPHPWVLDFGVSVLTELDAGLDPTRGRISGTPGYLAPEWLDHTPIDGRADCFSLGCVLYELLVGRGPFHGCQRLSEAAEWARRRSFQAASEVARSPRELDRVIDAALEPSPVSRVQSATELGARLLPFASERMRARYEEEFARA